MAPLRRPAQPPSDSFAAPWLKSPVTPPTAIHSSRASMHHYGIVFVATTTGSNKQPPLFATFIGETQVRNQLGRGEFSEGPTF